MEQARERILSLPTGWGSQHIEASQFLTERCTVGFPCPFLISEE